MPVALITGASAGLGKALAQELARRQWSLVIDARDAKRLYRVAHELATLTEINAIAGDVSLHQHRADLAAAVHKLGRLDLLVNNASTLGPTPLPPLGDLPLEQLSEIFKVNVTAPLGLIQRLLGQLCDSAGSVINLSSDAAIEHYEGWGAYGATKSALDHLTGTLASENPATRFYAVDPGDMRTAMQQAAFPDEDISDRPLPETVVPGLLSLIETRPASGRYRAKDLIGFTSSQRSEGVAS